MAAVATAKPRHVGIPEDGERMQVDTAAPAIEGRPEEDLYTRLKTLQRQLEFLEIQVSIVFYC